MDFFPQILGNEQTKKRLGQAILNNTLAHAFILEGPHGCGKQTLALALAMALNCEHHGSEHLPCGICNNCRRILKHNFPDVHHLSKKEGKSTIGVEEIRDIRDDIYLSPTESPYKIYVISDAHAMTPQAQNALLKIFEEPPRGVIMLLLCDSIQQILSTIKSRAQLIRMTRLTDDTVKEALLADEKCAAVQASAPEAFTSAIKLAQGSIGRAKELLSEDRSAELSEERESAKALLSMLIPSNEKFKLYSVIQSLPQKRAEFSRAVRMILDGLRDLILSKYAENTALLFFTDATEVRELALKIGHARLLRFYDAFTAAGNKSEKNGNINAILAELCVIVCKV